MKNSFFFFLLVILCNSSAAQDSLKTVKKIPVTVGYVTQDELTTNISAEWKTIDTSLTHFHYSNPLTGYNFPSVNLGNPNTARKSLWYAPVYSGGTDVGINQHDRDYLLPGRLVFYTGTRRFTELKYTAGGKQQQQLDVTYYQQLGKKISGGFDFVRSHNVGFFARQVNTKSSFDAYLYGHASRYRYNYFASFIYNHLAAEENGGVVNYLRGSQDYEQTVYLDDAQSSHRNLMCMLTHFWVTNAPIRYSKSPDDSLPPKMTGRSKWRQRVSHVISYGRNSFAYYDSKPDSGFFSRYYFDSLSTGDSLFYDELKNSITWDSRFYLGSDTLQRKKLDVSLSLNDQLLKTVQGDRENDSVKFRFRRANISAGGSVSFDNSMDYRVSCAASYTCYGDEKGNFRVEGEARKYFGKKNYLVAGAFSQQHAPSLTEEFFFSNHFIYENIFEPVRQRQVKAGLVTESLHAGLNVSQTQVDHLVYFGADQLPHQAPGTVNIYQLALRKRFDIGKFHTEHVILYQKISPDEYLHLPEWSTQHEIYFENAFFRRALYMQIGADVRNVSSYQAEGYQPATGKFFLQDSLKAGDYAGGDLFINLRIKAARLFFKFENVEEIFSDQVSYLALNYPRPGFVFRFGVSLRFYD